MTTPHNPRVVRHFLNSQRCAFKALCLGVAIYIADWRNYLGGIYYKWKHKSADDLLRAQLLSAAGWKQTKDRFRRWYWQSGPSSAYLLSLQTAYLTMCQHKLAKMRGEHHVAVFPFKGPDSELQYLRTMNDDSLLRYVKEDQLQPAEIKQLSDSELLAHIKWFRHSEQNSTNVRYAHDNIFCATDILFTWSR